MKIDENHVVRDQLAAPKIVTIVVAGFMPTALELRHAVAMEAANAGVARWCMVGMPRVDLCKMHNVRCQRN